MPFQGFTQIGSLAGRFKARFSRLKLGTNVRISTKGRLAIPGGANVSIGDDSWILAHYSILAHAGATVSIGSRVHLGDRIQILAFEGASIRIEDDCWLNHDISIVARNEIVIGRDSLLGPYCYLCDHDHGTIRDQLIRLQEYSVGRVIVGADSWLGMGVTLLKGAAVGTGAVVAARALVTKSVPEYEIWGGVPARRLGERK